MSITIEKAHSRPGYLLRVVCEVARPRQEVFDFFSDALQLERITPPFLNFHVLTPPPIEMAEGLTIDYRLRVRGFPIRWRSEISLWEPPNRFVDEQRKGPYSHWHHEHLFEDSDGGTRVIDLVHYGVPGGALLNMLFVRHDLKRIFTYRQDQMQEILGATHQQWNLAHRARLNST